MVKKIVALTILFVAIGTGALLYMRSQHSKLTASIEIDVAPAGAKVTINGKGTKGGIVKVAPGKYTVQAERAGFATIREDFVLAAGQSGYFGYALVSNSPETADWYSKHPDDQRTAERVSGRRLDNAAQSAENSAPIIKLLPYIGPGFSYRIDYGGDPDGGDKPAIYITSDTKQGRTDALNWIKSKGFNPGDYKIVYNGGAD